MGQRHRSFSRGVALGRLDEAVLAPVGRQAARSRWRACYTGAARGSTTMSSDAITQLLAAARTGDADATERLFAAVYAELKTVAHAQRRRWRGNETLNTTALIHEAYLKLAGGAEQSYANRAHFFATAATAMRQILVNYAEQQRAAKRGGDVVRVPLEDHLLSTGTTAEELLGVDELLRGLEAQHPRRARIVECRVFAEMTVEETADALDISAATVKREWQLASAALYRDLQARRGGS
jgi:RNA polymerase sigma factor (TIGR02999 family)